MHNKIILVMQERVSKDYIDTCPKKNGMIWINYLIILKNMNGTMQKKIYEVG